MKRCTKCGELKPLRAFRLYGKARPGRRQSECKSCQSADQRRRVAKSLRSIREYAFRWRRRNRRLTESANTFIRETGERELFLTHYHRLRHEAVLAYGGYRCACCGIAEPLFLTIDHVNNDGAAHRRQVGEATSFFRWLRNNSYPNGFQVLCSNCNSGRHRNGGICPHKDPVPKPGNDGGEE